MMFNLIYLIKDSYDKEHVSNMLESDWLDTKVLTCSTPNAHGEDFVEQSSTNETFLSRILTVCGQYLLRNCSFVAVRKISSMFNNFCHE